MGIESFPAASVVIPTHNRSALLRRVLDALSRQSAGTQTFEVVVIADGCVDDTLSLLAAYRPPFVLKVVERSGEGPAVARNAGVERASGELLIFLDDDVEPGPGFVAAHLGAHRLRPGSVGLGPYPPAPHASTDFFRLEIRAWWCDHFKALAEPNHRFSFRDLLTGNLSLTKRLWSEVGGLDPAFVRAREDLELGVRLLRHGVPFQFVADAVGLHHEHETATPAAALRRAKEEGSSDALMALKHPFLRTELKILRDLRFRRLLVTLSMRLGCVLDPLLAPAPELLILLQYLGLRDTHRALYGMLRGYWYWRGAMLTLGKGWRELACRNGPETHVPTVTIDLQDGIEAAEKILSEVRPLAARLTYGGTELGFLPHGVVAEAWDGRHLRGVLAGRLAVPFLASLMASEGAAVERARPMGWRMIGVRQFQSLVTENNRQWEHARVV